jgi:hypothetical protein
MKCHCKVPHSKNVSYISGPCQNPRLASLQQEMWLREFLWLWVPYQQHLEVWTPRVGGETGAREGKKTQKVSLKIHYLQPEAHCAVRMWRGHLSLRQKQLTFSGTYFELQPKLTEISQKVLRHSQGCWAFTSWPGGISSEVGRGPGALNSDGSSFFFLDFAPD